ncbi:MAG: GNAT family N-acetyltransferase [Lachnospiraceae bacterium]|nr:GNAT family N-acetyltransferase [Lachnospiraceae bacterium]
MNEKTLEIRTFDELSGREVYEILKARSAVFMMEQSIHYLDMDDVDLRSVHFAGYDDRGLVTRYLRMYDAEDDKSAVNIGRVLVMDRGDGQGRDLVSRAVAYAADKGYRRMCCDAQKQSVPFYEKCGFSVVSDEFIEAGIPHIKMQRDI